MIQGNSNFLNRLGLESFDLGYMAVGILVLAVLILILIIILIIQIVKVNKLKKRLDKFLAGKEGASLEQDIIALFEDNKFLKNSTDKNKKDISILFKRMESTYQKMGLVKYDAFNEMGGKLSFSLALLNEKDDGFIINAMHSREGCYTYIKEIIGGKSIIVLASEEKEALDMALKYK